MELTTRAAALPIGPASHTNAHPSQALLEFWAWAFSDLCDDDVKGIYAEWLVSKLIGVPTTRRCSWANNDVVTKDGVLVEVKASAYWQSWRVFDGFGNRRVFPINPVLTDEARVRFSGLVRGEADAGPIYLPKLKSQLYVFAFQHHPDYDTWNAMDLDQWEFYVVPSTKLKFKSISLKRLRASYQKLSADKLKAEVDAVSLQCGLLAHPPHHTP